ncbi:hypothetical protein LSAT2_002437 [Lamellibrachia satsuma]|nr:hypothetical protein LSAT2_002437 [Lamellibrachia satsuma]
MTGAPPRPHTCGRADGHVTVRTTPVSLGYRRRCEDVKWKRHRSDWLEPAPPRDPPTNNGTPEILRRCLAGWGRVTHGSPAGGCKDEAVLRPHGARSPCVLDRPAVRAYGSGRHQTTRVTATSAGRGGVVPEPSPSPEARSLPAAVARCRAVGVVETREQLFTGSSR